MTIHNGGFEVLTSIFNPKMSIWSAVVLVVLTASAVSAQTTAFTYQGKLSDGANPANGSYDMQFTLFDTPTVGTGHQQGPTNTNPSVQVAAGIFTVQLDFGAGAFSGPPRYLEIGVRPAGSPNPYTVLSPRQPMTSTPYSVRSLNSSVADVLSSACVGCVSSTQVGSVSGSAVTGTIPVASVPGGSGNYVQNTTSPQASSNFNISGDGTAGGTLAANAVNATSQYNIGGSRAFTVSSFSRNVFAGVNAGAANGLGGSNSFFGHGAGEVTASGGNNSFFGRSAGNANTASDNSFVGAEAGFGNSSGTRNSFFGRSAGRNNSLGSDNAFFGYGAGLNNTASFNSFFGSGAGDSNTTGARNSFFGRLAGSANIDATDNTFFGYEAGLSNTASFNSFFGSFAGDSNTSGAGNSFFGRNAGTDNTAGGQNSFFGDSAGQQTNGGQRNSFFGSTAGISNMSGSDNTAIGAGAQVGNIANFATAIGAGAFATTPNSVVLGRAADTVKVPGAMRVTGDTTITGNTSIAGSTSMNATLDVQQGATFHSDVTVGIGIAFDILGSSGSTDLCRNSAHQISSCSSSLRYKTSVQPFSGGLDVVRRLRPITFNWKDGGMRDVGFGAEDVEKIEPLFVTRNDKGEIEGVKYRQLTTVLVNAVKEQQAQITAQKHTIEQQQQLLNQHQIQIGQQQTSLKQQQNMVETLKKLVCQNHPHAKVCK